MDGPQVPWRPSAGGLSVSVRVTPRGGRDDIDGIETLADGRCVLKLRVRVVAEGGEANRAVMEVLARALGVSKSSVRLVSGATARLKQVEVDGDGAVLSEALAVLTAGKAKAKAKGAR